MDNKFAIITDMACDMPESFFKENDIDVASMPFRINGKEYGRDNAMPHDEFYDLIRAGGVPTTSQTDMADAAELFEKHLSKGEDVLYISFSGGVSGSFNNVSNIVRGEMKEKYPDRKIIVIDTLSGAAGQGLMTYYMVKMRSEGKSVEEAAEWLQKNKLKFNHFYLFGDLQLLKKGGRISKTQAILGTLIGIRPLLMLDSKGKNHVVSKIRGKKKAVSALLELTEKYCIPENNDFIMTTHSGCLKDAEELNAALKAKFNKDVITVPLTYLVGSHCGPDTIGVFFVGHKRMA